MNYDNLNKNELVVKLQEQDRELEINRTGIREKDELIAKQQATIDSLELHINKMESSLQNVVETEIKKVHESYASALNSAKQVVAENERVSRGMISLSKATHHLLEIKDLQNKAITELTGIIEAEYIEITVSEKESN